MASVALVLWYLLKEAADCINKTAFNVTTIFSVRCQETRPMFSYGSQIDYSFRAYDWLLKVSIDCNM